jgi:hypothetical protein
LTKKRVKRKDPPNPRNPTGKGSDHKFKNPKPGSKGKKRKPTPKELEFIKEHTTRGQ